MWRLNINGHVTLFSAFSRWCETDQVLKQCDCSIMTVQQKNRSTSILPWERCREGCEALGKKVGSRVPILIRSGSRRPRTSPSLAHLPLLARHESSRTTAPARDKKRKTLTRTTLAHHRTEIRENEQGSETRIRNKPRLLDVTLAKFEHHAVGGN